MYEIEEPAADAYLIKVSDGKLQAYLQSYPYLVGPDRRLNQLGLIAIREGFTVRRSRLSAKVLMLEPADLPMPSEVEAEARRLCRTAGIGAVEELINDFQWKAAVFGAEAKHILAFGCGGGDELVILRAMHPQAAIDAIDWEAKVAPKLLEAARINFKPCNINSLEGVGQGYDLIFSSHTVEHLFDPDAVLANLASRLAPGGALVCALPLDGSADDHFRSRLVQWGGDPSAVGTLDLGWADPGHPWKTNSADLLRTLSELGFEDIKLYQRAFHIPRGQRLNEASLKKLRHKRGLINALLISPFRALIGPLAGARFFRKLFYGVSQRVPWGDNYLKNAQSRELTFVAYNRA